MAHIFSTWLLFFVSNGLLGPYFSKAGQNTGHFRLIHCFMGVSKTKILVSQRQKVWHL